MTRQVALAAVVAFAVTVLILSIWTPSAPPPRVPAAVEPAKGVAATPMLPVKAPRALDGLSGRLIRGAPQALFRVAMAPDAGQP
jgi:hypothetical protein